MNKIKKITKVYFIITGIVFNIFITWMILDLPIFFDRSLIKSEKPILAEAIICIAGGTTSNNLPTVQGWNRIYTAVQLYFDNYASKVIFTGAGGVKITEAEIYAEAALWLGCPEEAIVFCPKANSTAEHPLNILKIKNLNINRHSALNIVTSDLHSRRTEMCFKKRGFSNFRMITYYSSKKTDPAIVRNLKASRFKSFRPSNKKYDDIFTRLRRRTSYFFTVLRELAAIGWYKIKGYV